jgi:RNA polymerase sigma factor (sigma-70 family)
MAGAPGLVRFAARYTRSLHDAEDAYQRAMEIALTRAPSVEPKRFAAWLHTVLRNEALAVAAARRREGPAPAEDVADTVAGRDADGGETHAVVEWRERYRSLQDALASLTVSQRVCVMLMSAGASYAEIAGITGFSLRKVERSVLEGRARLHAWELRLASGEECDRLRPVLERVADRSATQAEARTIARHVRHCRACRALLRSRRQSFDGLASLVPPILLLGSATGGPAIDPSHILGFWDRLAGGVTVRAGHAWQTMLDVPSLTATKVGAGAAAAVLAGATGAPYLVDALGPEAPNRPTPVAKAIARPSAPPASGAATAPRPRSTATPRTARAPRPRAATAPAVTISFARLTHAVTVEAARQRSRRVAASVTLASAVQVSLSTPPPAPHVVPSARPSPAPAPRRAVTTNPAPRPAAPSPVALEFGP